ncbi:MAG TPA: hypothetical protein VL242_30895 [Sorangium sp.]|uniref:Uncharacterized protein n=1 Tax=Sorangium cellulosum TaxID=56 RepID=A0A150RUQ3_SORCE|nr:hypothetical protein BE17_43065 [Sorangium cellulosum]HTN88143.1 hypothetical protein [Sorangium sp.]
MYDFSCDWRSGFVMDPLKKQRVGYLVSLNGFGLTQALQKDIIVYTPFNGTKAYGAIGDVKAGEGEDKSSMAKATVVGVLESFSWGGGVGDPLTFSAYLSQENANQIQIKQQTTLKNTVIKDLAWWIVNYDEELKEWFEECHPAKGNETIIGQLNAPGKTDIRLAVASEPVKVAPNIDVNVYNVYFEVVPAANLAYDIKLATSSKKKFIKGWGLKVGTQAEAAVK